MHIKYTISLTMNFKSFMKDIHSHMYFWLPFHISWCHKAGSLHRPNIWYGFISCSDNRKYLTTTCSIGQVDILARELGQKKMTLTHLFRTSKIHDTLVWWEKWNVQRVSCPGSVIESMETGSPFTAFIHKKAAQLSSSVIHYLFCFKFSHYWFQYSSLSQKFQNLMMKIYISSAKCTHVQMYYFTFFSLY